MKKNISTLRALSAAAVMLLAAVGTVAAQTQNQITKFEYDTNGNLTKITDPLLRVTDQEYDALNRLKKQLQPIPSAGASRPTVQYVYDGLDQLIGVTDPRNVTTAYTVDGLGNLTTLNSPDTGATTKTYDDAGNVKTITDAKQQTTSFQYDVLNRVTQISYADGNIVTYQYDQGANAIGRLTQVSDANSTIQYAYDVGGRVMSETRTITNVAYITQYGYDNTGRLATITYPSGRVISYTRDALSRISQIDTTKDSVTKTLVSQVTYRPFGQGVQSFLNGANQTVTRSYDLMGRLAAYTLGAQTMAVGYDAASRIKFISDALNPVNTQNFDYDDLDRLTSYSGTGGNQTLGYDLNGNRTSKLIGTANTSYTTSPTSNRMTAVSGAQNAAIQIDNNGSITNNGLNQFSYDARGRMTSAETALGTVQYKINAFGQRIAKTVQGATTVFHYDQAGKLIAESNDAGNVQKEYIYLADIPVAVLQ